MPTSHYIPGHEPPSITDRILAHPFVLPFSGFAILAGVLIIVAALTGGEVSRSLADTHTAATLLIGGFLAGGAPVSIYGALNPPRRRRGTPKTRMSRTEAMQVEMIGNTAVGTGWLTYSITVIASANPFAVIAAGLGVSITLAYALRSAGLQVSIRRIDAQREAERHLGE